VVAEAIFGLVFVTDVEKKAIKAVTAKRL